MKAPDTYAAPPVTAESVVYDRGLFDARLIGLHAYVTRHPPALSFSDWLAEAVGTRRWVVAARLSDALRAKEYELAVNQGRYQWLERQWAFGADPVDCAPSTWRKFTMIRFCY